MQFTAEMIASFLGGVVEGDKDATVTTVAKIEEGHTGALSFLSNPKYTNYIYDTQSSIVIVNSSFEAERALSTTLIRVEDAYAAFAKLLELYAASKPKPEGVSSLCFVNSSAIVGEGAYVGEFAVVGRDTVIGSNVSIYPGTTIGDRVTIGDNVIIYSGVHIYEESVIGNNVIIHSGCVIGADGFGFAPNEKGEFSKIPQIGNVIIEDNVEIGANTCIDRATMGSTVVKRGVKLDNLIQVAHNAAIGEHTVAASQVGIAGSSKVGAHCMLGGQVGLAGHITIADRVQIGSQSGVPSSVKEEGSVIMGYPAISGKQFHRASVVYKSLPDMSVTLRRLEREVAELKKKLEE